eukprot:5830734-Prymnesium_polylepis.1
MATGGLTASRGVRPRRACGDEGGGSDARGAADDGGRVAVEEADARLLQADDAHGAWLCVSGSGSEVQQTEGGAEKWARTCDDLRGGATGEGRRAYQLLAERAGRRDDGGHVTDAVGRLSPRAARDSHIARPIERARAH